MFFFNFEYYYFLKEKKYSKYFRVLTACNIQENIFIFSQNTSIKIKHKHYI